MGCKTCHGADPDDSNKAIIDFMRNVVKPTLSDLLGIQPGSMPGVRCGTCHTSVV
jgi:hypothetical protein